MTRAKTARLDREIAEVLARRSGSGVDSSSHGKSYSLVPGVGQVHELEDRLETSDGRLVAVRRAGRWQVEPRLGRAAAQRVIEAFPELFAEAGSELPAHRVAYLVPNPRRGQPGQEAMRRLWYAGDVLQTMSEAMASLRAAKRRGYTAWVVDEAGRHVPVAGAARRHPGVYST